MNKWFVAALLFLLVALFPHLSYAAGTAVSQTQFNNWYSEAANYLKQYQNCPSAQNYYNWKLAFYNNNPSLQLDEFTVESNNLMQKDNYYYWACGIVNLKTYADQLGVLLNKATPKPTITPTSYPQGTTTSTDNSSWIGVVVVLGLVAISYWVSKRNKNNLRAVTGKDVIRSEAETESERKKVEAQKKFEEQKRQREIEYQQKKLEVEYKGILEKYGNYIDKFCEIAEREVSVRDAWGDENFKALPKLKQECIIRVAKKMHPEMQEDDMLQWFNDYRYYKYIHTKWKNLAGDKPDFSVSFPRSNSPFDSVLVPYWVYKFFNETLDERFKKYHEERKEHYVKNVVDFANMSGVEFEVYLSTILEEKGYSVSGTPTTGDQGADIIASKGKKIYVIQAKRHSQPVGNNAVQEVTAARNYYKGDIGVVIASGGFTTSAKALARRNDVILISGKEIPQIADILQG